MSEPVIWFTKQDLGELLGELALPPFVDHPEADSWNCASLATVLSDRIDQLFAGKVDEPLLGLATTRQLLEELRARFTVQIVDRDLVKLIDYARRNLTTKDLDYRTVDS